ncbi:MAG: S-layer homology domain-containing protein [Clostridia bacterium]|nr:S-layer homology domain-containing protein [Clostridia bacterium]
MYDSLTNTNNKGIVTGTSATTFAPTASVTREQMATLLMRYCESFAE